MPELIQPDTSITVPAPEPKSPLRAPTILIAISVALVLIGCGLCSVGGFNFETPNTLSANIGKVAFLLGGLGLFVGVLWWLTSLVANTK